MKISCDAKKLKDAFGLVAPAIPAKAQKAICQNVKLEAGDVLHLVGSDTELSVRAVVDGVTVQSGGEVLLSKDRFSRILTECQDEDALTIELDGNVCRIKGKRSTFRLPTEDPRDYPTPAGFTAATYYTLPAAALREVLKCTVFATDQESHRFALGGVNIDIESGKLNAVGTDGRRLAVCSTAATLVGEEPTEKQGAVIVPAKAVHLICGALETGDVMVAIERSNVIVKSERATVTARLLEGKFPRWRDVLPNAEPNARVDIPAGQLFAAIRQAAITTDEESQGVDFKFAPGTLTLGAEAREAGESTVELPVPYDGEGETICLNHKFLAHFFRVVDGELPVSMELRGPEMAAVFAAGEGYRYVLMPLSRDEA